MLFRVGAGADEETQQKMKKSREKFRASSTLPGGDFALLFRIFTEWKCTRDQIDSSSFEPTETADDSASEISATPEDLLALSNLDGIDDEEDDMNFDDDAASAASSRSLDQSQMTFEAMDVSLEGSISSTEAQDTESGREEDVRALSGRVRAWSRDNFVNNAALRRSAALERQFRRSLVGSGLWGIRRQQSDAVSDQQLRDLVFHALAMNLSIHVGGDKYRSVVFGTVASLSSQSEISAPAGKKPQCIVWHGISRNTFENASDVDETWVDMFPKLKNRPGSDLELVSISGVPIAVLETLFSTNNGINSLESVSKELGTKIDVDLDRQTVSALCSSAASAALRKRLESLIADAKADLNLKVLEEGFLNSTRLVFGSGCEIVDVLHAEEFISFEMKNLTDSFDLVALKAALGAVGIIRDFQIKSVHEKSFVIVTCANASSAADMMEYCAHWLVGSDKVAPHRLEGGAESFARIRAQVLLSWPMAPVTRKAFLTFSTAGEANSFIQSGAFAAAHPMGYDPNDAGGHPRKEGMPLVESKALRRRIIQLFAVNLSPEEVRKEHKYKVKVKLDAGMEEDEDGIRKRLAHMNIGPIDIAIVREHPGDAGQVEELPVHDIYYNVIPPDITGPEARSEAWIDERLKRAGVLYFMPSAAAAIGLAQDRAILDAIRQMPKRYGHTAQLATIFRSSIAVSASLWRLVERDIRRCFSSCRRSGALPSVNLHGQNKVVISLLALDLQHLQRAAKDIEGTLQHTIFTHRKKALLFSTYGRHRLFQLSSRNPVIQVDTRTQSIRLYSIPAARTAASQHLCDLIEELAVLQIDVSFVVRRSLRHQIGEDLKNLQLKSGVADLRIFGSQLVASGTAESIEALRLMIKPAIAAPRSSSSTSLASEGDCPICFESLLDVPSVSLVVCSSRSFCLPCLTGLFSSHVDIASVSSAFKIISASQCSRCL